MPRSPYLSQAEAESLFRRVEAGEITITALARDLGRDRSALYRLFNRRFGFKVGHATGYSWASTLLLPEEPALVGYIAGIIDGEGSIIRSKKGHWSVKVTMTDFDLIRWLGSLGGKVNTGNTKPPRQPTLTWHVSRRRDVVLLLNALLPYLRVKKGRAEEALAILSH